MSFRQRQARRARLQIVVALVYGGAGLVTFLIREDLAVSFGANREAVLLVSLGLIAAAAATVLMLYLRGDVSLRPIDQAFGLGRGESEVEHGMSTAALARIAQDQALLRTRLEEVATAQAGGTTGDRQALVKSLSASMAADVASELANRFASDALAASHLSVIRESFAATQLRLEQQIESLNRRANLNLIIGVFTTLAAVGLLAYMVLTVTAPFADIASLLSHYVPRITTVVFIEVFSFFFLRLYKSSLAEVQYYQNELTTLASQQIAIEAAHAGADTQTMSTVVHCLANGHRDLPASGKSNAGEHMKQLTDLLQQVAKLVADNSKAK